jgi:F-type H+-transporting ATPase subunit b
MDQMVIIQAVASAATFCLLWAVLGNLLFKPLFQLLEEREARTSGDEQAAVEKRHESKELAAQIEEKLRIARVDGAQLRDSRVAQAKKEAQEILDRANTHAAEELKRAEKMIAELKAKAMAELPAEVEKLSQLVVSRALAESPTGTIH